MPYTYSYPRPAVTVDIVVFGYADAALQILLIQRKLSPFAGSWALPGGFVHMAESLEQAADRELREEVGLKEIYLEQLYTFGDVKRDPRQRTISVAYSALVASQQHSLQAATDASAADWFDISRPPRLAFDHEQIVKLALQRLRSKIRYCPIGFELLPKKFTLSQLQQLYEAVLGVPMDKRNFRKKTLSTNLLVPLLEYERNTPGRAAQLFRFDRRRYQQLIKTGYHFEV